MLTLLYFLACYIIASVSGIRIAQSFTQLNVREVLSTRPNYLMFMHWKTTLIVVFILFFDFCKAIIPLYSAYLFKFNKFELALFVLAVIMGHYFSLFNRFKGELGAVVNIGLYSAIGWPVMFSSIAIWLICYYLSGYRAIANVCLALLVPIHIFFVNPVYLIPVIFLSCIVVYRHFSILMRIRYGYFSADCNGLLQHYLNKEDFLS